MHIRNKILLIALSMILHGAVRSMEQTHITGINRIHTTEVADFAWDEWLQTKSHIARFAYNPEHNSEYIRLLGKWLKAKRYTIIYQDDWTNAISDVTSSYHGCYNCTCPESKAEKEIQNLVKEVALNLKAGEDCSEQLVKGSEEILQKFSIQRKSIGRTDICCIY